MAFFQLLGAGISAYASIQAGKAKEDAARMDAFNTETEREQGEVLALQQAAQRRYEYDIATKTNVAMFAASGRDIGSDRSVEAFLEKQKKLQLQILVGLQSRGKWKLTQELEKLWHCDVAVEMQDVLLC